MVSNPVQWFKTQGFCLPFSSLSTLNGISCSSGGKTLFKYADNMALVAHLTDIHALSQIQQEVTSLVQTFVENSLELNISKTKELCCGARGKIPSPLFQPLSIQGRLAEQVQFFKYLGTETDTCLSFTQHTDSVRKKAQQCFHLLKKLRTFHVSKNILILDYRSLISPSTFHPGTTSSPPSKTKLSRVLNQASKITGSPQPLCLNCAAAQWKPPWSLRTFISPSTTPSCYC